MKPRAKANKGNGNWLWWLAVAIVLGAIIAVLIPETPKGGEKRGAADGIGKNSAPRTLPALAAAHWQEMFKNLDPKYRAEDISQVTESSEKGRALYATLSDEQRVTLLKTGKYSLAGAKATPAQGAAIRDWLQTTELRSVSYHLGEPPDIAKAIINFDKRSFSSSTYLCLAMETVDGSFSYGGHQIALWPEAGGEAAK